MQRTHSGFLVLAALAALLALVACGGGGGSKEDQAKEAEWAWLTQARTDLDGKRQQLADLEVQAAAEMVEAEATAAEAEATAAEAEPEAGEVLAAEVSLEAQITQLEDEIAALSEEFGQRLVAFINADPMIEGEPPTERQVSALRMKSDEDIALAQEWIEKGGDYKRAIEIYNTALMFDSDNPKLQAALAAAEADRYMNAERFAAVEKGMVEDEVRAQLGQVNLHNVREYPDKNVVAWFYPTSEDGSAAAVWFQPDSKSGELEVYQIKFEAISPEQMQEE